MKQVFLVSLMFGLTVVGFSLTAEELIQRVDKNQVYTTMKYQSKMLIQKGNRTLTKTFVGLGESGDSRFF